MVKYQVKIETSKGYILCLIQPKDTTSIARLNNGRIYFWTSALLPQYVEIPEGKYQFVSHLSNVTKQQCYNMGYEKEINFKLEMQANEVYEVNPYEIIEEKYFYQRKEEGLSWGDFFVKERIRLSDKCGNWIILFKEKI